MLWSAMEHQFVYINTHRLSLCPYSKLVFPDAVSMDGYGDNVVTIGVYRDGVMSMEVYGGLYKWGTWL